MQSQIKRVELALNDLRNGKMVVLTDDPDRENEGDLIIPAEKISPEGMNFLIRNGSGIICISMEKNQLTKLNLPLMVPYEANTSLRATPFTVSVDAKDGITTGVSALDRTKTIQTMINANANPEDLVKPGHIFPLQAKDGGVLERQGHTEGAVDLVKLAGFKPAAILCEIMNPDGTMARGKELNQFALKHKLTMLSIDDIMTYRVYHENLIEDEASSLFPLDQYGMFKISILREKINGNEHVILFKEGTKPHSPLLLRIHSSCFTGDLFASMRCDCNNQLHHSLQRISEEGGMLIYLNQEGRGIGLFNKIKAYHLQEKGYDTVEANEKLGLPIDSRKYYIAANILHTLNIKHIKLLTNNPHKIDSLKKYGIDKIDIEPMPSFEQKYNHFYLKTKKLKLQHNINLDLHTKIENKNSQMINAEKHGEYN
ncbi:MAG: 3,4-dihydroxy-2-butanone-4-phosphate synthase [Gammaproteobacteria bacterium]|nr:3,4-dihydroxy-2-butanone-4-phosphate synthase [Gammaproteobacteria bacterium]MCW5583994.1 3,4-dihydroxy-2-butanone-4-phosphate synthase [Gammaproteobacteria bacterium]